MVVGLFVGASSGCHSSCDESLIATGTGIATALPPLLLIASVIVTAIRVASRRTVYYVPLICAGLSVLAVLLGYGVASGASA